ncbi:MAG: hypothetical protein KJ952_02970 [Candidatus Omnitrophica bacterium]|nr:hypothetical protein [Candidatus Omnitrophota bacterium]
MNKIIIVLTMVLFCTLCLGISVIAEEITLTTYYPAPYGAYVQLAVESLGVGDNNSSGAVDGNDVPSTSGDVWIEGNVGIGIGAVAPNSELEVAGTIRANTAFNFNGTDGHTGAAAYTVVTAVRLLPGPVLQRRTRTITVEGGIITDVGAENAWF